MAKLSAPYNFVPISKHVYTVDYGDKISMDVPFKDGEDGIIELEIKNHTPLFIGGKKEKDQDQVLESRHVRMPDGTKRYYIPGTTLKGCIRSVMEVISFAKMQQFNNDSFGWRNIAGSGKKSKSANGCGWLRKDGKKYYISPCKEGVQRIKHKDIIKLGFKDFKHEGILEAKEFHETAIIKINSLGKEKFPEVSIKPNSCYYFKNGEKRTVPEGKYQLVCTGCMRRKNVEYLFSKSKKDKIEISEKLFKTFDTIHKNTKFYSGFLLDRLMDGKSIPVFFYEENGEIKEIGITANYRNTYKNSIQDCVKRVQEQFNDQDNIDLPEAIFGYVNDNNSSLRGRVLIGNAFCDKTDIKPCPKVSGVLGQPRASFYPLYLKQTKGKPWVDYNNPKAEIAGRKRYRIHQGLYIKDLPQYNEKKDKQDNVTNTFIPLPKGMTFKCRISIHNLRKVEIGALLSSITFNKTLDTYHNIGMAKSFGYGVVTCKVAGLKYLNHSVDEYIAAFNEEMSAFLKKQKNDEKSSYEESLKKLINISSPIHNCDDVRMMELTDYTAVKREKQASVLHEKN